MSKEFLQSEIDALIEAIDSEVELARHSFIREARVEIAFAQALLDRDIVRTDGTTEVAFSFAFRAHLNSARRALLMAVNECDLIKERNRVNSLPTAEKKYARWREIASDVRREKPYLNKKTDIAKIVRTRLVNSHDPQDQEFVGSTERIRKVI